MPTLPAIADRAFPAQHGIEEDETEDTVDVEKDEEKDRPQEDDHRNQSRKLSETSGIEVRKRWGQKFVTVGFTSRCEASPVAEAASADVQFPRQDGHESKTGPLC